MDTKRNYEQSACGGNCDTVGNKAADKFEKLLIEREIAVIRLLPTLKDFNEDLQALVREPKQEMELKMA